MKRKVSLSLSTELLELIDRDRGLVSRSAYLENELRYCRHIIPHTEPAESPVNELLGHSSSKKTEEVYSRSKAEESLEAGQL
jgi:hypothetical protein